MNKKKFEKKQKARRIGTLIIIILFIMLVIEGVLLVSKLLDKKSVEEQLLEKAEKYEKPTHNIEWRLNIENSSVYWINKPNHEQTFDGCGVRIKSTHIKINSDGLRDYEYDINKSNNTFRIIVLGDSFSFGWGVELDDVYMKVLERKLNNLSKEIKYEVINLGVAGYNSKQEVELFKLKGIKYKPDLIIIGFTNNDDYDPEIEHEISLKLKNNKSLKAKHDQSNSKQPYSAVNKLMKEHIKDVGFEANWKKTVEKAFTDLALISKSLNSSVLIFAMKWESKEQLEALSLFVSETENWILKTTSIPNQGPILVIHKLDPHPNEKAHIIYAEEIYDALIDHKLIQSLSKNQNE